MQSSDTATGLRVNCLYHIFSKKWKARNKQAFYFWRSVILRYKLRDFLKIYYDYLNDPNKRRFSENFVIISDRQEKFRGI